MRIWRRRIGYMITAMAIGAAGLFDVGGAAADTQAGHSAADAAAYLDANLRIPGTSWVRDMNTGVLVVRYDESVTTARLDRLKTMIEAYRGAVRLEPMPGVLRFTMAGGQSIYSNSVACTLGFNVIQNSTYYILTAGHCVHALGERFWARADHVAASSLGVAVSKRFGGSNLHDIGLIRYDNPNAVKAGVVDLHDGTTQDIIDSRPVQATDFLCKSGRTSRVTCGHVTNLHWNGTVHDDYSGDVYLTDMIETDICVQPGDSGAPLYSGHSAIGITSASTGCGTGGRSLYTRATTAEAVYDVNVF
jgi:S1-C subfamily serine protease